MKNKKGKRYKKRIINKFKFIRSILILILIIILITITIIKINNNIKNKEEKNDQEIQETVSKIEEQANIAETTVKAEEEINTNEKNQIEQDNKNEDENENENEEDIPTNEEVNSEEKESEEIKQLIQETISQNNLNENNFGFFFYNIETKEYYFYNENKFFTAASTIKVPVSMVYYDKINNGELTEDSLLLYEEGDYEEGAGRTASTYDVGDEIPLSFLIKEAIINSDNTAVNILIGNLGYSNCKKEITKYTKEEIPEDFYTTNILSAKVAYDIVKYLYENQENYIELIEYMKQSSNGQYLKANIEQYEIAHKYGSYDGYVHDYGIIYGKNTYLIGVFTYGISEADTLIANIGEKIINTIENDIEETKTYIET